MSLLPYPTVSNLHDFFCFDPIFDMIGEGSFANVFKATHRESKHAVALKIINKKRLSAEKLWRDVVHEVEIMRRLEHHAFAKLYDVLQTENEVVLVMELIEGGELFQVLQERGSLSEGEAANILLQLLQAVNHLHTERRVVHRDLKPENILISKIELPEDQRDLINDSLASNKLEQQRTDRPSLQQLSVGTTCNHVSIVDFGLAKYFGTHAKGTFSQPIPSIGSYESLSSHTNSPVVTTPCGSLKYCAPETVKSMIDNGQAPRETTRGNLQKGDVYSVGVVAYIMLSGSFPFNGKTKAMLSAQMENGPKFTTARWAKVSEEAKDFVAGLLRSDPGKRPSAKEACAHPWLMRTPVLTQLITSPRGDYWEKSTCNRQNLNSTFGAIMEGSAECSRNNRGNNTTPTPSGDESDGQQQPVLFQPPVGRKQLQQQRL